MNERKKRLFLDSANVREIEIFARSTAVVGLTTNPSLMAKEAKGSYVEKLTEIIRALSREKRSRHLSVEVTTLDPAKMEAQARELHAVFAGDQHARDLYSDTQVFIKIPIMLETLPIIGSLSHDGVRVNATACMTALQAKMGADAGAKVVSFFYNRMLDGYEEKNPDYYGRPGGPGSSRREALAWSAEQIRRFKEFCPDVDVICGSIRKPEDVLQCWSAGADIVTAPFKIIEEMIRHPKTDEAVKKFQEDIDKWLS